MNRNHRPPEKERNRTMGIRELILQNRSYRGFDHSRKVTGEELLEMVDCARLSASSGNQQPLKYVLICTPEHVEAVQKTTRWAKALPEITLPHPGHEPTAFIVICQDRTISDAPQTFLRDVGISAQSILLKAAEMGLGGCMIGSFLREELIRAALIPDHYDPMLVIAVGKPDEKVVLTEAAGSVKYYRDEADVHYVPKRRLEDIVSGDVTVK